VRRLSVFLSSFAFLICTFFSFPLHATVSGDERILSFDSRITIHQDAVLTVQETIRVLSDGKEIKRGIYRDFPTVYRDKLRNLSKRGFRVVEVKRAGKPEPFVIEALEDGRRVRIGNGAVLLPPGEHVYTITYRTDRQLGFFGDHDELYWNVTGNDWQFAIDSATATVELPPGAPGQVISTDGYTGRQGAKGKNFTASQDPEGKPFFSTKTPLEMFEGLTIVVSWPKGLVKAPTQRERIAYFFKDNQRVVWGLAGLALVILYFMISWFFAGRDPRPGAIMPIYTPPDSISPAASRFLMKMGYDDKVFSAAVISMAVKGVLKISGKGKDYTLIRLKDDPGTLPLEERKIFNILFNAKSIKLDQSKCGKISSAIDTLKHTLKKTVEQSYFVLNRRYFLVGVGLSICAMAYSATEDDFYRGFTLLPFLLFPAVFIGIGLAGLRRERAESRSSTGAKVIMPGIGVACYGLLCAVAIAAVPVIVAFNTSPLYALIFMAFPALNYLFFRLLKAPTSAGSILREKIEGFKMFLSATEQDRLNRMNPPEKTPELFERYLPYALALDVEQQWAEQFSEILSQAQYEPQWYEGALWNIESVPAFSSSIGSSFSSAVSASSTPPGSSSGSSGSGSSGGGGGGGGGGGW